MSSVDVEYLVSEVTDGDQKALSRFLTYIENSPLDRRRDAIRCLPSHDDVHTIGVTGPPGVGKSTLLNHIAKSYRDRGDSVGVIAVDPASPYSGGSVMGDRIRQSSLSDDSDLFFRSMSSSNLSGGLTTSALDAIHALAASGRDTILVETVGTGQSEVDVMAAADTVCLVLPPSAGDDVQASKAGILEIADVIAVNKADLSGSDRTITQIRQSIELGEEEEWTPPVHPTTATEGGGITEIVSSIDQHYESDKIDWENKQRVQQKRKARIRASEELERLADQATRNLTPTRDPYEMTEELLCLINRELTERFE